MKHFHHFLNHFTDIMPTLHCPQPLRYFDFGKKSDENWTKNEWVGSGHYVCKIIEHLIM